MAISWQIKDDGTEKDSIFGYTSLVNGLLVGSDRFLGYLAFNLKDRKLAWKFNPELELGSDYISDSQSAVGGSGNVIYAETQLCGVESVGIISKTTGKFIRWIEKIPEITSPENCGQIELKVVNNRLYLTNDRRVLAYDISQPETPKQLWVSDLNSKSVFDFAVDGDLYVTTLNLQGDSLFRISAEDGSIIWKARNNYPNGNGYLYGEYSGAQGITTFENKVIVGSSQTIQAFDKNTGKRIWLSPELQCRGGVPGGYAAKLEVGGGKVYAQYNSMDCVHAINLSDGSVSWVVSAGDYPGLGGGFSGKALYHNGVVYSANGRLYAIEASSGKVLSISRNLDRYAHETTPQLIDGEIVIWGLDITAYKPLR
jgi:outer membrane protein assembly factor BamB